MRNLSFHQLILGLVLGVLLTLAGAYYAQGRELTWLRQHHIRAHERETELKTEIARLKERLSYKKEESK